MEGRSGGGGGAVAVEFAVVAAAGVSSCQEGLGWRGVERRRTWVRMKVAFASWIVVVDVGAIGDRGCEEVLQLCLFIGRRFVRVLVFDVYPCVVGMVQS